MSTYSYDLATDIGKIRLLISDNDIVPITDAHFSDEEITVFLTMAGGDINLAAAYALQSWAGFLSGSFTSERIGDYAYSKDLAGKKLALAQIYLAASTSVPVTDWAEMDLNCIGEE